MVERSWTRIPKINQASRVILFDIDGVLVTTLVSDSEEANRLLCLHPDIKNYFQTLGIPYGFISHRSIEQAKHILSCLGISSYHPELLISANDFAYEAVFRLKLSTLLRDGLLKSLAIPLLRRRLGLFPHQIAVVDDGAVNLDDLFVAGVGLTMKSPANENITSRKTVSFELSEVISLLQMWSKTKRVQKVELKPKLRNLDSWSTVTVNYSFDRRTLFSFVRQLGKQARFILKTKIKNYQPR